MNPSNEFASFLQKVLVSIQSGGNRLNTYAFLDNGSTVTFIDQIVQDKVRAQGTDVSLNIAGIHGIQGSKDLKTERVPLNIKGIQSKLHQSKRLHTRHSPWETQTTTTASWITWVFYPPKVSTWWNLASSLVKMLMSYNAHWTTR